MVVMRWCSLASDSLLVLRLVFAVCGLFVCRLVWLWLVCDWLIVLCLSV